MHLNKILKHAKNEAGISLRESILSSKNIFLLISAFLLVLLPFLARNAGISGDEEKHHRQAVHVYNYYATFGADTNALSDLTSKDPMQYNGQFFDTFTYCIEKLFHVQQVYEMRHFFNALVGWLVILFTGLLVSLLIGYQAGTAAMLLLFISPIFLGHAYNNNKDIPFALGVIMSIYYIVQYFRQLPKPTFKISALLALSIALSISVRIAGLIVMLYLAFFALMYVIKNKRVKPQNKTSVNPLFIKLSIIVLSGYFLGILFWPFLLVHPISHVFEIFRAIKDFPITLGQIFEGQIMWSDQIPWYYLIKYILITIPLVVLFGFALFFIFIKRIIKQPNGSEIILIAFTVLFPIIYSSFNTNDYGGWRHLLFVYPPLVICSVCGFYILLEKLKKPVWIYLTIAIFAALCLKPVWHIIKNHPHEYVYYNELAGGVNGAYTHYEMDYFQNSPRKASEWLINHIEENKKQLGGKVIVAANASISYFFRNDSNIISTTYCKFNNRFLYDWDYMIICNTYIDPYVLRTSFPPANTIYQIKVDSVPVCIVIERKQKFDLQAMKYVQNKNFNSADSLYNIALTIEPQNVDILLGYAKCLIYKKNYDSAQVIANQLYILNPKNTEVLNLQGIIYKNTNRLPNALNTFKYIIENLNPRTFQAWFNLGNCYAMQNDFNNAQLCFEKCLNIDRESKEAYMNLAQVLYHLGRNAEADVYVQKAKMR